MCPQVQLDWNVLNTNRGEKTEGKNLDTEGKRQWLTKLKIKTQKQGMRQKCRSETNREKKKVWSQKEGEDNEWVTNWVN